MSDTGWIDCSPVNANVVSYRKIGQIVYVRLKTQATITKSSWVTVGEVPVGYRPASTVMYGVSEGGQAARAQSGGSIQVYNNLTTSTPYFYFSYIAEN